MIEPSDSHKIPIIPDGEHANRERCTDALDHLRVVYRHVIDAGKVNEFDEVLCKLALDLKAALGGKEKEEI